MIIRDITEQIEIQGMVVIKEWDEEKETYNILDETEIHVFDDDLLEREIKYMYAINGSLVIEVE